MDEKNKDVKTTEEVKVNTGKKNPFKAVNVDDKTPKTTEPVETPSVKDEEERIDVSRSLEEHLEENQSKVVYKINFRDVLAVIIMFIVLIACGFLIYSFFTTNSYLFQDQTTTTTRGIFKTTTKTTTQGVITIKTTALNTKATHEVFVTSKHTYNATTGLSTSKVIRPSGPTTTVMSGKTTKTSRTSIIILPDDEDDKTEDDVTPDEPVEDNTDTEE